MGLASVVEFPSPYLCSFPAEIPSLPNHDGARPHRAVGAVVHPAVSLISLDFPGILLSTIPAANQLDGIIAVAVWNDGRMCRCQCSLRA